MVATRQIRHRRNNEIKNYHELMNLINSFSNGSQPFNLCQSKSACISINGVTEIVTGQRNDARNDHYRHSHIPDWVILDPDGDVHIFNELVDDAKYEDNKNLLIETMLVMSEIPQEPKIKNNVDPDGLEVSAELASKYDKMWSEAYAAASELRSEGNHGAPIEIQLSNDNYDVFVHGTVGNHNDDGSDNYTGTIEVKSKEGELLASKEFSGSCICES